MSMRHYNCLDGDTPMIGLNGTMAAGDPKEPRTLWVVTSC